MSDNSKKQNQEGKDPQSSIEDEIFEDNKKQENIEEAVSATGNQEQQKTTAEANQKKDPKINEESKAARAQNETQEEMQAVADFDLGLILDIPLEITVELGRAKIQIQELLKLGPGSAVTLSKLEGEPVDIRANDKLIARGEVVVQNKKYGIRITEITSRMDRIKSLND